MHNGENPKTSLKKIRLKEYGFVNQCHSNKLKYKLKKTKF